MTQDHKKPQPKKASRKKATKSKKAAAKKSTKKMEPMKNALALILWHKKQKGKKISLKDIQRISKISYPVIVDFNNQRRDDFTERTILGIAKAVNVSVDELMGKVPYPPVK